MTIGTLTRDKFKMKIDSTEYDVFPDLRSLTGSGKHHIDSNKYKKELDKLHKMQQSVAIYRQIALKKFYEKFVYAVKKEAGTKGKLTQDQLESAFKTAVTDFQQHYTDQERNQKIIESLASFKAELATL